LKHTSKQSPTEALFIFERVLFHLSRLHEFGYCHRDVKPENILKTDTDWIIIDFAISTSINTRARKGGTITYMDPAQFFLEEKTPLVSTATDVWGIGMVLLFLIKREVLADIFIALENLDTKYWFTTKKPDIHKKQEKIDYYAALRKILGGLSQDIPLEKFCAKLLNPDPENRPSLAEIKEELELIKVTVC
jgi:serine/threonine protein kinase